ncbi:MAG: pilus assembly protein PilX [Gammaproteobacteria bacterium]|nr:pilus assembly protein PilX [Gammaproteobacteria bacterium]
MKTKTQRERGIALISSLLLLMILTIIALSMFRSFATQERVAGNLREKERALHAAEAAQQYAEWWLNQPNSPIAPVACAGTMNANNNQGQVCNQTPAQAGFNVTNVTAAGWPIQVQYLPPGMSVTAPGPNKDPPYALTPGFYITDLGRAADNLGEAYLIDAYGSGSTAMGAASTTVAVVQSTYEIQQGVTCLSCPGGGG